MIKDEQRVVEVNQLEVPIITRAETMLTHWRANKEYVEGLTED